jgi:tRNA-dihydrouridine synthase A
MMDWTDRHCRAFHRVLTGRALLYTEMVTTGAMLHGDRERLLGFDPAEHPVGLQLGGSDPAALAASARIGAAGYDEINLNVGCPSDRVQDRPLRGLPDARAGTGRRVHGGDRPRRSTCPSPSSAASASTTRFPPRSLFKLVDLCAALGSTFVVHARKAWLQGLSPRKTATSRRSTIPWSGG